MGGSVKEQQGVSKTLSKNSSNNSVDQYLSSNQDSKGGTVKAVLKNIKNTFFHVASKTSSTTKISLNHEHLVALDGKNPGLTDIAQSLENASAALRNISKNNLSPSGANGLGDGDDNFSEISDLNDIDI